MQNSLILPQQIRIEGDELIINGRLTNGEFLQAIRYIKRISSCTQFFISDLIKYGENILGEDAVCEALAQAEFDLQTIAHAAKIGTVEARLRTGLTSEHLYVLAILPSDQHEKWAIIAVENNLTARDLKESIAENKIIVNAKRKKPSGRVSILSTATFYFKRWLSVNKPELVHYQPEEIDAILEDLKPVIEFTKTLQNIKETKQ